MAKSLIIKSPKLGNTKINFYDISEKAFILFEETKEFEREKKVPQLGIINKFINSAQHTRYDYLIFELALVDLFDKIHKGTQHFSLGSLKYNGKQYSGNSILKTWFMLSNFGHGFNGNEEIYK